MSAVIILGQRIALLNSQLGAVPLMVLGWILLGFVQVVSQAQPQDADQLLEKADRLAWVKAWARAAPIYAQAAHIYRQQGNEARALYAEVSRLRGELHRRAPLEVSETIAGYLDGSIAQRDARLRLRCLVIKGETDQDLDPAVAERSWREALDVATALNEQGWANRARGELGVVAFLQGDLNAAIVQLGQALQTAQATNDRPSLVRWRTLYGHGYLHLNRPEQALAMYDLALEMAATVPELQSPVMTLLGKGDALIQLGRLAEAESLLRQTLATATDAGAPGYQAEVTRKLAELALRRGRTREAFDLFTRATTFAAQVGANRIVTAIASERAALEIREQRLKDAEATLSDGIRAGRDVGERFVLPRLLGQLAEVRRVQGRYREASDLLDDARDLAEGVLINTSSPWLRSQLIGAVLNDVYVARIQLAGRPGSGPAELFAAIEEPRARSLNDLLLSARTAPLRRPPVPARMRTLERDIARLQLRLYRANKRQDRRAILRQIFLAEERLAPATTEWFDRTRVQRYQPVALAVVQRVLHADEVLLEYALTDKGSFCLIVTSASARVQRLPSSLVITKSTDTLMQAVQGETDINDSARTVGTLLLSGIPELQARRHIIVSADGDLHRVPFELLVPSDRGPLVRSHVVSYVPSGSILHILRRATAPRTPQPSFVVSTSPNAVGSEIRPALDRITRGTSDVDVTKLPALPSGEDEARAVRDTLGPDGVTMLLGSQATEAAIKQQPLADYQVLHFAVHGVANANYPDRSGIVVRQTEAEDGVFQAREIVRVPLRANLVVLSACNTARGAARGQEGIASLVRPFLAAGARSVVANLWEADDRFSLALMRAFYRWLASGVTVSDALTRAKRQMLDEFGPSAVPKFWSGIVVNGDGSARLTRTRAVTDRTGVK